MTKTPRFVLVFLTLFCLHLETATADPLLPNQMDVSNVQGQSAAATDALADFRKVNLLLQTTQIYFKENHVRYLVKDTVIVEPNGDTPGRIEVFPQTKNHQTCNIGSPQESVAWIGTVETREDLAVVSFEVEKGKYELYVNDKLTANLNIDPVGQFFSNSDAIQLVETQPEPKSYVVFGWNNDVQEFLGTEPENNNAECTVKVDKTDVADTKGVKVEVEFSQDLVRRSEHIEVIIKGAESADALLLLETSETCSRYDLEGEMTAEIGLIQQVFFRHQITSPPVKILGAFEVFENMQGEILQSDFAEDFKVEANFPLGVTRTCQISGQPMFKVVTE